MKTFLFVALVLFYATKAFAQDAELNKLSDIVNSLRTGGEKAYIEAVSKLSIDKQWTPMDELGIDMDAECKMSERPKGFKLNSVLTNAENSERYQTTTANHLNGADKRYNYSLFEKTLKAGKSATYKLNGRWGEQTFIIIPYAGKVSSTISSNGQKFSSSSIGNGVIKLTGNAREGLPIEISIMNDGNVNVSYVIINYNSRK